MVTPATGDSHSGGPFATGPAVAVVAPDGALTGWSPGAQRLLGYSAAEAVGRPAADLLASPLPRAARERLAGQDGWVGPVVLRHRDGHPAQPAPTPRSRFS
ncbi:PAS domain-containing protein [Kitasatospora aureofaciens]|uniref:PAS domain-containing protein n=1 Tax=Kitasatospora aureofaciens TaxID=1894 RepID=UPI0036F46D2C